MLSSRVTLPQILKQLHNSRALIRTDFNVPLANGVVSNNKRIVETLPTLKAILSENPKGMTIMSHLGRPEGNANKKFTLKPVAAELERLLGSKVTFIDDCIGQEAQERSHSLNNGEILLLENLRFYPEEEGKGKNATYKMKANKDKVAEFRRTLSTMGDVYINDAFGTSHRAHSSMVGIDLPIRAAGLLLKKELDYFAKALETPKRPFLVILGGAKVSDKIQLIMNLLDNANDIIIGSAMAFPFLKVLHGMDIGKSMYDSASESLVMQVVEKAKAKGVNLHFPEDFVCGDSFSADANVGLFDMKHGITGEWMGMDQGPKTCKKFAEVIARSETIVWNGPQGVFEFPNFRHGSVAIVDAMMKRTEQGATTIVGGGDSVTLVQTIPGAEERFSHLSTGGGASLELLEGKELPGLTALSGIDEL